AKTPPAQQTQQQSGSQPVQQKDTVTPKNSKEDVEAIGNRSVGKGVNLFSLEREISLGKSLAQEVERSSKMIDDPVVTEYVNRVGQNLVRNSDARVPLTFLKFSRDAEREADFLGLQYMYKTGYDPNSYVTFFERIQADEKRRPGTIPKVFSTHPPTPDRIENTQKEIARILPAKQEYLVTTSEFDTVKARLRNIMFSRKVTDNAAGKPTLRTKTEQSKKQPTGNDPNSSDDDRPTLKRRPDSQP